MNDVKKLYRIPEKGMVLGVCAGIADYFSIDVNIVRILTVLFSVSGMGAVAYIVACFIMPIRPREDQ